MLRNQETKLQKENRTIVEIEIGKSEDIELSVEVKENGIIIGYLNDYLSHLVE